MVSRSTVSVKPEMMHAVHIRDGALQYGPAARPTIDSNAVLIKVAYAGVNRADLLQVQGLYAPPPGASALPGLEVSGSIAALGEGVRGWHVGEEVCALLSGGGYAEYVAVPAAQVLRVPASLTLAEAATWPEAAATAYMALVDEASLQPGERVLLHGGTSGLGIVLAQAAKAWGAEVYATVGNEAKAAVLARLGIHAIVHRAPPFAETLKNLVDGVDVIVDTLGGPQLEAHLGLLRPGGRLVCLAAMEGGMAAQVKWSRVLMKQLRICGANLRNRNAAQKAAIMDGVRRSLWPQVAAGAIRPFADKVFPLESAEKAHRYMQERLHIGKILLEVAPERAVTAANP